MAHGSESGSEGTSTIPDDPVAEADAIMDATIDALEAAGRDVVDGADIDIGPASDELFLLCEFKTDIATYLETYTAADYPKTLADLIAFNEADPDLEGPVRTSRGTTRSGRTPKTRAAGAIPNVTPSGPPRPAAAGAAIDDLMAELDLDAIVAPTNGPAWVPT